MNEEDIRNYANLMQELELTGLEITDGEKKVRLERNVSEQVIPIQVGAAGNAVYPVNTANAGNSGASANEAAGGTGNDGDYISVKSPIVGVFYAASAESADPYVSVGDRVNKGQTLCIIEAMKLMNEITAEEEGTIAQICVTNGQVIEYGTELFRIKR
jgi:acetyl-CoA carboxylase biotin carboxyl carrier protein